jgi:ATP-dependent RNA helicase DDX24/MAK5
MSQEKQERILSYGPCILIGTPGRIWELINGEMNEYLVNSIPSNLEVLVLDEADRMVEVGHFKEMNLILDFIYIKRELNTITTSKSKNQDKSIFLNDGKHN